MDCTSLSFRILGLLAQVYKQQIHRIHTNQRESRSRWTVGLPLFQFMFSMLTYEYKSADMVCHWEDSDTVAQEMFSNVSKPNISPSGESNI